jgi:hypothetical protein
MAKSNFDFDEMYKFSNDVRIMYGAYTKQSFIPMTGKTFKSGRPKWIALFTEQATGEVHKHEAMQLISKKTNKPYYKVRVQSMEEQESDREIARASRQATEELSQVEIMALLDKIEGGK